MHISQIIAGSCETIAADISLSSQVDLGESSITLNSNGMGPLTATGMVEISSNGSIVNKAGNAIVQLGTNIANESSVLLDGGLLGNVTIANGAPAGNSQTVEMNSLTQSIDISNGNIPGAMQAITMCGLNQSIEINAGGLPISPTILMSPMGIKLSCGPANFIEITPAGVTISGLLVDVKAVAQANVEGALVSIKSEAITSVQGAIVTVN